IARRGIFRPHSCPFLPALVPFPVGGLARRDHHQQAPQIVPVVQPRETAILDTPVQAVEGTEGDILLINHAVRRATKFDAGQPNQSPEVTLPQLLGSISISGPGLVQPMRNRSFVRHTYLLEDHQNSVRPDTVCDVCKLFIELMGYHSLYETRLRRS